MFLWTQLPAFIPFFFFFFNDTATTEIYTLSLHDALPIWRICLGDSWRSTPGIRSALVGLRNDIGLHSAVRSPRVQRADRKSTRLNSSHLVISYAVFCLKKKKLTSSSLPTY